MVGRYSEPGGEEGRAISDFSSARRSLRTLLENAWHAHLIADVPVGFVFSSGWIPARSRRLRRVRGGNLQLYAELSGERLTTKPRSAKHCETLRNAASRYTA